MLGIKSGIRQESVLRPPVFLRFITNLKLPKVVFADDVDLASSRNEEGPTIAVRVLGFS